MDHNLHARNFMQENIHHIISTPYHPSTNSLVERGVQMLKRGLKRTAGSTVQEKLSRFLSNYRISPHSTTAVARCELLMKCRLRSRLDLIHPDVTKKVESKQGKKKLAHDTKQPIRTFTVNDHVLVRNLSSNNLKWLPGVIVKVTAPLLYIVCLSDVRESFVNISLTSSDEIVHQLFLFMLTILLFLTLGYLQYQTRIRMPILSHSLLRWFQLIHLLLWVLLITVLAHVVPVARVNFPILIRSNQLKTQGVGKM